MAATIQMMEPIAIAPCIPWIPLSPVAFSRIVAISSVAIAIPETGLLLLPTRPTILEDTVAKKKPKITTIMAPMKVTGIGGASQIAIVIRSTPPRMTPIFRSCPVRVVLVFVLPFRLFMASLNVRMISGRDFTRLMIPPAANAPAPI